MYMYMANVRYVPDFYLKKPAEVIAAMVGDCDEQAILLCSLLRAIGEQAFVRIAAFPGMPVLHAWVVWFDMAYGVWRNLDPSGRLQFEPTDYGEPGGHVMKAYLDFNDTELFDYGGLAAVSAIFQE